MSNELEKSSELDLQAILKKAEQQTDFPDVPLDEFTPPTYEEWKEACITLLKGAPFDKKMYTKTYEGITFDPMYFRKDTEDILPKGEFPGMGDYLRGAQPSGYVGKPWGIAQSCDETLPKENNALLRHEQEKGSTVYNIRLDRATLDAKDVRKAETPGDEGVSLTTLEDVHTLLEGLKLDKFPLYIYAGASALPMLSLVAGALKSSGQDLKQLKGFVGASPLGALAEEGGLPAPLEKYYDEMAEAAKWAKENAPGLKTVFVRSDVFSRGGCNDVQESAYTLATAVSYLRALLDRGLNIEEAAQQIVFGFSMGANFFLQIAKLRALRPLWAQIVEAFGGSQEARRMHIHGRPALFFKTVYDPYVNMLRNTTEIFSAPHCPQCADHPAGGIRPFAAHRSCRRFLGSGDSDQADEGKGLGGIPENRGQGRHAGSSQGRLSPGGDCQGAGCPLQGGRDPQGSHRGQQYVSQYD